MNKSETKIIKNNVYNPKYGNITFVRAKIGRETMSKEKNTNTLTNEQNKPKSQKNDNKQPDDTDYKRSKWLLQSMVFPVGVASTMSVISWFFPLVPQLFPLIIATSLIPSIIAFAAVTYAANESIEASKKFWLSQE